MKVLRDINKKLLKIQQKLIGTYLAGVALGRELSVVEGSVIRIYLKKDYDHKVLADHSTNLIGADDLHESEEQEE